MPDQGIWPFLRLRYRIKHGHWCDHTFGVQADIVLELNAGAETEAGQRITISVLDVTVEEGRSGVLALVRMSRGAIAANGGQRIAAGLRAAAASIECW